MAGYSQNINTFTDYGAEQQAIDRRRKMAELLSQQAMQPVEAPANAPVSWTQGLAKLLQGYGAGREEKMLNEQQKALSGKRSQALAAALGGMPTAQTSEMEGSQADVDQYGMAPQTQTTQPTMQQNAAWLGQLAQIGPDATQIGGTMLGMQQKASEADENRDFRKSEAALARQARADQIQRELAAGTATKEREAELRRELRESQDRAAMERAKENNASDERMQRFMVANRQPPQPQTPVAVIGDDGKPVLVSPSQAYGRQPYAGSPQAAATKPMSATAQKEVIQTDEEIAGGAQSLDFLGQAKKLNEQAMGFPGAGAVATMGGFLPEGVRPKTVDATQNLTNVIQNSALPSLKAIFGGNPTEGERKILLEVQGSASQPPAIRKEIFDRAEAAVSTRLGVARQKARALRQGTYFSGDGGAGAPPAPSGASAGATGEWSVVK